ncbi:hypothetical protein ANN_04585 [Periplaneta americana]|uniref:Uncharacterized protein n=1 Tax=Periplaneta americana TaxID=6978 RepID=A0ABQ8T8V7_PERAM|nr:hypothetical protein ANN_04585 [Periplaneta americana]
MGENQWSKKLLEWMQLERRKRGRPKTIWTNYMNDILASRNLMIEDALERHTWRGIPWEEGEKVFLLLQEVNETWTLTLREEHRLRVFENKVLRKLFGAKRDEVTGEWRKLHNTELHALYSSPDIIRNIKSRRLRWAGHVARMGESRNNMGEVIVGRRRIKRIRFADDMALLAEEETILRDMLLELNDNFFDERIPNFTGEQSDGITVFRIPPMTSLMLHRCRTGAINLQRWWQSPSAAISESDWFLYRARISKRMTSCTVRLLCHGGVFCFSSAVLFVMSTTQKESERPIHWGSVTVRSNGRISKQKTQQVSLHSELRAPHALHMLPRGDIGAMDLMNVSASNKKPLVQIAKITLIQHKLQQAEV